MNRSEVWARYSPEERARRCAAISAGKFKGWAKRKLPRSICKVCGKPASKPRRKYCSKACQHADIASWVKGPPRKERGICKICGGVIEETRNKLYCSNKCHLADPQFKEDVHRGHEISWLPEKREQAAAKMRGRAQTALLTKKGPAHARARQFRLRSPEGILYKGRNIRHFVRTHEDLFDPQDVIWRRTMRKTPSRVTRSRRPLEACLASKGLASLFGVSKFVRYSWKGWTRKLP